MNYWRGFKIIYKKELKDYFASPLVYILAGLFSIMTGVLFYVYILNTKNVSSLGLTQSVIGPIMGNMNFIFIFICCLLTMRQFSEEKKQGTLNLLFLSQVKSGSIILGKLLASFTVACFMISLTTAYPIILAISGYHDWMVVCTSYLGLLGSVLCYLSVGLFASGLSENQIVSGIISFTIIFCLLLLVAAGTATDNIMLRQIFYYMSVPYHFEGFSMGAVKNYSLLYFASFIGFFFYLTSKVLESRKW